MNLDSARARPDNLSVAGVFETLLCGYMYGRALADSMQRSGRLADGTPVSYAYGLDVDRYRGVRRVQHGGRWRCRPSR